MGGRVLASTGCACERETTPDVSKPPFGSTAIWPSGRLRNSPLELDGVAENSGNLQLGSWAARDTDWGLPVASSVIARRAASKPEAPVGLNATSMRHVALTGNARSAHASLTFRNSDRSGPTRETDEIWSGASPVLLIANVREPELETNVSCRALSFASGTVTPMLAIAPPSVNQRWPSLPDVIPTG